MKKIAIFGSTGSIGTSTLNVIRNNKRLFKVVTLVAGHNVEKLMEQIEEFKPKNVYIIGKEEANKIKDKYDVNIYYGDEGIEDISNLTDFDVAVQALVGISGLKPTYNMLKNGKTVALANKEVLVTGGNIITKTAKEYNARLLSIDSEHSAITECLAGENKKTIEKILLTCSGGPFFDKKLDDSIKPEDALNHPTWKMGPKVTIDSATLMNKGFEVLEAKWLFGVDPENIEVVVHRQSLMHSAVQFNDGTIMANIGPKSMEIPISYALNLNKRVPNTIERVDLFKIKSLVFEKPDLDKFKCLRLAYEAHKKGHSFEVILNAADEVLVNSFIKVEIKFTDIPNGIEEMMNTHKRVELNTVDDIIKYDREIKEETLKYVERITKNEKD